VSSQEHDRETEYAQLAKDADETDKISRIMRTAAELTLPSVVHLETTMIKPRTTGVLADVSRQTTQRVEETGTGIIVKIDAQYWVVTNSHVVGSADPEGIRVLCHDSRLLTPKRTIVNSDFDIAVIEIAETDVIAAKLGDGSTVQLADRVLVLGSPFGLSGSVTGGMISAVGRRNIPKGAHPIPLYDMLQTDASINPGNSGGPLVNMRGEVIGIIAAIASSSGTNEGVGFAIPIQDAMRVVENLVRYGEMQRPYLGIELTRTITDSERITAEITKQIGVKITRISPNSPAAVAGLKVGDILVKYNETDIEDDSHFIRLVVRDNIGGQVKLSVFRHGETLTITPVLAAQKSQ